MTASNTKHFVPEEYDRNGTAVKMLMRRFVLCDLFVSSVEFHVSLNTSVDYLMRSVI